MLLFVAHVLQMMMKSLSASAHHHLPLLSSGSSSTHANPSQRAASSSLHTLRHYASRHFVTGSPGARSAVHPATWSYSKVSLLTLSLVFSVYKYFLPVVDSMSSLQHADHRHYWFYGKFFMMLAIQKKEHILEHYTDNHSGVQMLYIISNLRTGVVEPLERKCIWQRVCPRSTGNWRLYAQTDLSNIWWNCSARSFHRCCSRSLCWLACEMIPACQILHWGCSLVSSGHFLLVLISFLLFVSLYGRAG